MHGCQEHEQRAMLPPPLETGGLLALCCKPVGPSAQCFGCTRRTGVEGHHPGPSQYQILPLPSPEHARTTGCHRTAQFCEVCGRESQVALTADVLLPDALALHVVGIGACRGGEAEACCQVSSRTSAS